MSHFKRGKTGRWDLSARHSSCMSLCKRVDWCPYCSSWSAGTGKSETYRASELSRTMTGHASVARQCLLPEETQARRVELEMPVMVLVRVPASPLQLLVAFVTYHSPPKRQNPPVTVVSLVLTLAAHRLSLSRSAPAFFTISTRDPRWPEQAGSLRSSLVTPFLVLPPVAGRRVLVLLALSQLPSASPPPPVSGTGTATVLHSRGAAWAPGCCVFFKKYSLGCVGCGTRDLVSLRPGGSSVAPCGISFPDQGWGLCPCTEGGSLARGPPGPSPLVPLLLSAVLVPLPRAAVSPGGTSSPWGRCCLHQPGFPRCLSSVGPQPWVRTDHRPWFTGLFSLRSALRPIRHVVHAEKAFL